MTVYCISGLGADKRVFKKIQLPENYRLEFIDWLLPIKSEKLPDYSMRLAKKINSSEPFMLMGLSFGGIVVTEIAKNLSPQKSIIISSISTARQLPWYLKLIGMFNIHKAIPVSILRWPNPITFWLFGTKTNEEKEILTEVLKDTDKKYLKWAINSILKWKNDIKPASIFHIHGAEDKILPIRYTQANIAIEGGRHFMILSMAEKINEILNKEITNAPQITS